MLKAFLLLLVLSFLEFAFLEWLFWRTPDRPGEHNKPSEPPAEKKVRAARAGGRDS